MSNNDVKNLQEEFVNDVISDLFFLGEGSNEGAVLERVLSIINELDKKVHCMFDKNRDRLQDVFGYSN